MIDARGIPTNVCPVCGGNWFNMQIAMEEGEVVAFLFEAICADEDCQTKVTIACPIDIEGRDAGNQS